MIYQDVSATEVGDREQLVRPLKKTGSFYKKVTGGLFNYRCAPPAKNVIPITVARKDTTVRLVELNGGVKFRRRLIALGMMPKEPIRIINNLGVGPILVEVKDTRLAIGRGEAEKIMVCDKD